LLLSRLTAIAIVIALSLPLIAVSAKSNKVEWLLVQDKLDIGEHLAYVAPDAVKIVSKKCGYQLLVRAPDWKVYCFRPNEKLLWIGNLRDFSGIVMMNPAATVKQKIANVLPAGEGTINGLKCTNFTDPGTKNIEVMAASEIQVCPQVAELACRYFGSPSQKQYPLYYRVHGKKSVALLNKRSMWFDPNGLRDTRTGALVRLNTRSGKQVPYNAADFDYPHGYKTVTDIKQVTYSREQKKEMESLLDDIGFVGDRTRSKTTGPSPSNSGQR
jgi:hypothetical protein